MTSCFVKFVRYYSRNEELTGEILKRLLGYPFKTPTSLNELAHLEDLYDVLDLYLWLSFRFAAIFCQKEEVFEIRSELEEVIFKGVKELLSNKNSTNRPVTGSNLTKKVRAINENMSKRNALNEKIQKISTTLRSNFDSEGRPIVGVKPESDEV